MIEFYQQGDIEREMGIEVSPNCDRNNQVREAGSIGFANFLVRPLYQGLAHVFTGCNKAISLLEKNNAYWQKEKDKKEAAK